MAERRVVITGLGPVSPIGVGKDQFLASLRSGRVAVDGIRAFDAAEFPCRIAGEIAEFSCKDYVPKSYRKSIKVMARDIELAVVAADCAVRDSGLKTKGVSDGEITVDSTRLGVNIGAGLICPDLNELTFALASASNDGQFSLEAWGREGMNNLTPLWLLKYLPNMLACHVSIIHDAQAPSNTITCAEASSQLAIGEAWRTIKRDCADVCLCGGAESKVNPMGLLRQDLIGRLTRSHNDSPASAVRPFDAKRDGTVIAEGGAVVQVVDLEATLAQREPRQVLASALVRQLVRSRQLADDLGLPMGARICRILARLAERLGEPLEGPPPDVEGAPPASGWRHLPFSLTHDDVALMAGCARVTATRVLGDLKQAGVLGGTRGDYALVPAALEEAADRYVWDVI